MSAPTFFLLNVIGIFGGIIVIFGGRVLLAYVTTKDYFTKYIGRAEALGFRERQIEVRPGLSLNVAEGPRGGVPLLLIPGQGCVWQEYCKAMPELVDTFHVLAVDVHGHGKSTWNADDYTGVRIADDLLALVSDVFDVPVVVAGHSSGGLIAALMAARDPERVRAVYLEDPPFFSTEPERVPRTYVGIDSYPAAASFLAQDAERDFVCWYLPRSYWRKLFGRLWPRITEHVISQRRAHPDRLPVIRWLSVSINRIWESMSHPFDVRFSGGFVDNSWFAGFDQAETLGAITCPTSFLKATTRVDRQGILLAALSDDDLARVESLLPDNRTRRVRSSHDIHFARTRVYVEELVALAGRTAGTEQGL